MRCPGSIRMIAAVTAAAVADGTHEVQSSSFAREGTFAHAVAAHILSTNEMPEVGSEFVFDDHDQQIVDEITAEMLEHVMVYVEHARKHAREGVMKIEHHVDLSPLVRDDMYGTSDVIISKAIELVVSDFKYGYYPVHIIDWDMLLDDSMGELGHVNSQLLYYAAGAAHQYNWKHKLITLEIVQPRCMEVPTIQSTTVTAEQLKNWAERDLYRAAHLATSDDAPLHAGEWCRFCAAMSVCPEVRKSIQTLAATDFEGTFTASPPEFPAPPAVPETLSDLINILHWAPIINAWLAACEVSALQLMTRGVHIPGFKLVEKRSFRKWPDGLSPKEIFERLKAKGATGQLKDFVTSDFLSPAKAEKIAGKTAVNEVCIHPRGELTVAAESDRRAAASLEPVEDDFEEFR